LMVLGIFLLLCFSAAVLGSMATAQSVGGWYAELRKPPWTPPNWVFAPVWTVLYTSMAVAAWLVWLRAGWSGAAGAFTLFALQLSLNVLWSWLFFGFQNAGAAAVEVVGLWLSILASGLAFWRVAPVAGWLMVPYLGWVTFAAALNLAIWRLNA
jgi:benzodiazapine receptor